jgi:hypothetical protein
MSGKTIWISAASAVAALLMSACGPQDTEAKAEAEPAEAEAPAETAAAASTAAAPAPKLKEIDSPGAAKALSTAYRSDMTEIAVAPKGDPAGGDKLEYMVRMKSGDPLLYSWEALDGDAFWHEFHGHTDDAVTFYQKADGVKHQGSLSAPFDGIHGWYFENRSDRPVIVRLRLSGFYERMPVQD